MTIPLDVVIIATAVAVCAGLAFTVRTFHPKQGHDHGTTELLKRFFDRKACAICKRPIPPVHLTGGLKPGLWNPTTHETRSWDEIPNKDVSTLLESYLPVCSACEVAESFRQHFPERVFDPDESTPDARSEDRSDHESRAANPDTTQRRIATE